MVLHVGSRRIAASVKGCYLQVYFLFVFELPNENNDFLMVFDAFKPPSAEDTWSGGGNAQILRAYSSRGVPITNRLVYPYLTTGSPPISKGTGRFFATYVFHSISSGLVQFGPVWPGLARLAWLLFSLLLFLLLSLMLSVRLARFGTVWPDLARCGLVAQLLFSLLSLLLSVRFGPV